MHLRLHTVWCEDMRCFVALENKAPFRMMMGVGTCQAPGSGADPSSLAPMYSGSPVSPLLVNLADTTASSGTAGSFSSL